MTQEFKTKSSFKHASNMYVGSLLLIKQSITIISFEDDSPEYFNSTKAEYLDLKSRIASLNNLFDTLLAKWNASEASNYGLSAHTSFVDSIETAEKAYKYIQQFRDTTNQEQFKLLSIKYLVDVYETLNFIVSRYNEASKKSNHRRKPIIQTILQPIS